MVTFRAGDRVKHPTKTEWDIGQVLGEPRDGKIKISVGVGEKVLSLAAVRL